MLVYCWSILVAESLSPFSSPFLPLYPAYLGITWAQGLLAQLQCFYVSLEGTYGHMPALKILANEMWAEVIYGTIRLHS